MTDKQLVRFVAAFRDGILGGDPSDHYCFMISAPLEAMLRLDGLEVELIESDLGFMNHFWLRLADGRALDPTADQFNSYDNKQRPPIYLGPPMPDIHPAPAPQPARVFRAGEG